MHVVVERDWCVLRVTPNVVGLESCRVGLNRKMASTSERCGASHRLLSPGITSKWCISRRRSQEPRASALSLTQVIDLQELSSRTTLPSPPRRSLVRGTSRLWGRGRGFARAYATGRAIRNHGGSRDDYCGLAGGAGFLILPLCRSLTTSARMAGSFLSRMCWIRLSGTPRRPIISSTVFQILAFCFSLVAR